MQKQTHKEAIVKLGNPYWSLQMHGDDAAMAGL